MSGVQPDLQLPGGVRQAGQRSFRLQCVAATGFREGPIPQGIYWIRPDELDDNWLNCRLSDRFANAWGRYRISIHPFTTETFGRGGFFIHGGATPGSAGCIDLTNHMDRFVAVAPGSGRIGANLSDPSRSSVSATAGRLSDTGQHPHRMNLRRVLSSSWRCCWSPLLAGCTTSC
ncbi:MAG: DUF2778 domain-containing protein [Candidatus Competibacteraceae bacterium]